MKQKLKQQKHSKAVSQLKEIGNQDANLSLSDIWCCQDSDVLLDFPNRPPIFTTKSRALQPFLEKFEEKIATKQKAIEVGTLIKPLLNKIKEIDSAFILFSEVRNILEVKIFLKNKKFNRKLADKLFDIRLALEDSFEDHQIDFLYIPIFDMDYSEFVSQDFDKVYP